MGARENECFLIKGLKIYNKSLGKLSLLRKAFFQYYAVIYHLKFSSCKHQISLTKLWFLRMLDRKKCGQYKTCIFCYIKSMYIFDLSFRCISIMDYVIKYHLNE